MPASQVGGICACAVSLPVGARIARPSRDGSPDEVRTCLLPQWIKFAPARRERTRGGEPNGSPSSCESPSPPSGRAARAEVSDAFHLPPGSCYTAGMVLAAAPEGAPAPEPAGLSAVSKKRYGISIAFFYCSSGNTLISSASQIWKNRSREGVFRPLSIS